MLSVDIEKIVPVTSARDMFNKIVDDVEDSDSLYVLTKNGKPAAVVVGINHLEKLTGETSGEIMNKVGEAATTELKEETRDTVKPFNVAPAEPQSLAPATPSVEKPAVAPSEVPSTDTSAATPTTPSSAIPSSNFNAAPAMPDETPASADNFNPVPSVTDGNAKSNMPADNQPATPPTTTSDPFASSTTPNADAFGSHNPTPGAAGNTNATPPADSNEK